MDRACLKAVVSGFVQGVGYRYYVLDAANILKLTGYAKNLSDGRVEVLAEGQKEDLELLAEKLKRGSYSSRVEGLDITWTKCENRHKEFQIL